MRIPVTPHAEYRRLVAAGVNRKTAAILAGYKSRPWRWRYRADQLVVLHARNIRPKPCPDCGTVVQACNLARHRRRMHEAVAA